jgi:hypothetical protein
MALAAPPPFKVINAPCPAIDGEKRSRAVFAPTGSAPPVCENIGVITEKTTKKTIHFLIIDLYLYTINL